MQLNEKQKYALSLQGNSVIVGGPGAGKSTLIFAKVSKLIKQGVNPESIAITCFTEHNSNIFKNLMVRHIGQDAKHINYSTFKDLAELELKESGSIVGNFADDSQVRRLLHQAKLATDFKGSIHEAEHIIRNFKSKAKKPQPSDEFYDLFSKYQDLLHNRNWYDRYDCLRQHLIAMRNGVSQPSRVKYLFVDCAQDITQIQMLWVLEHSIHSTKVMLCIDDDQCTFNRSGALGSKAIDMALESEIGFTKVVLDQSYRLTENILNKSYSVVNLADQRYSKGEFLPKAGESDIEVKSYNSKIQETESVIAHIKHYFKTNPTAKVGVLTRNDEDAMYFARLLEKQGLPFTDLSRNLWQMPGAIVIVDLLEVLIGTASNASLKNVLSMMGLSSISIDLLFRNGLDAKNWLQNGAKLDRDIIEDSEEKKKVMQVQSTLTSYYSLRVDISIKDIFKALCFELLRNMSAEEDKKDALIAIEKILGFKGDLKSKIKQVREVRLINLNAHLMVGPVREFRNMEFTTVFVPYCNNNIYPLDYKVLGKKNSADRRVMFMALTRAKGSVYVSYNSNTPSPYLKTIT